MKKNLESQKFSGSLPKVVIYSRVSTDEQAQHGLSIEMQPRLIRQALDAKYGKGGYVVVAEFDDAGFSGSLGPTVFADRYKRKRVRPGLAKVLALLDSGGVNMLAVQDVGRLYRDVPAFLGLCSELLGPKQIELFSATEDIDLRTPTGRLNAAVLGAAADYQRASSNEKIVSILGQRRRDGLWQGSAPYGWRFASASEVEAGAPRTLVPIPDQLAGVARAAELYLSGHSLWQVARLLNREGVAWTRNHNRPENRVSDLWTDTRVKLVLRCPAHAGLVKTPDGELIRARHAEHAPISPELFHQVATAMDERRTKFRGVIVSKKEFALSGIVRCLCCGGKLMAKRMSTGEYAYICPARRLVDGVEHAPIWARIEYLEPLILSELKKIAENPEVLDEARRLVHQRATEGSAEDESESRRIESQLEKISEKRTRLLEKLVQGVIQDDDYSSFAQQSRQEETALRARLEILGRTQSTTSTETAKLNKALEMLSDLIQCWRYLNPCEQAELFRATIESIAVGVDEAGNFVELKIRNFDKVTKRLPREYGQALTSGSGPDSLTFTEIGILYYFTIGKKASEIATMTGRTKSTISTICSRILQRLDVPNMKQAVKVAGRLAIDFAETFDLEALRKRRRAPKGALTAMEAMAVEMRAKGLTPMEMAQRGVSLARVGGLLERADAKLLRKRGPSSE